MNKEKIYLDNASTTPVDKEVLEEMTPYFNKKYGNPSSIHSFGQEARVAIDDSREKIAQFLSAMPEEIIFTGSATEANNIFIQGAVNKFDDPHIITSAIEHDAVLETVENLKGEVTVLDVDQDGLIDLEELEDAIQKNTALVTVMYANNEVGTIEPIQEIGDFLEGLNQKREREILFHTDAAQAVGYLDCNVEQLKVDGLTMSGHKIYGPKGVGALYKQDDVDLQPLVFGGGQEQGLRSGTHNTPLIVGMGKAVELLSEKRQKEETEELRDYLIDSVLEIEEASLNGPQTDRLSNNANFSFQGVEGESIVMSLDQEGIATSTGSACSSESLEPSHVLKALGLSNLEAHSSLRVSVGRHTNREDIDYFLDVLSKVIKRLKKVSGR